MSAKAERAKLLNRIRFDRKFEKWAAFNVASGKLDSSLKILKPSHPEIPTCSETLLKTDLQLRKLIRKCNPDNPLDHAEMVYFGIALHLLRNVNPALHLDRIIWLIFNIDGLPSYKSSSINFWITMCKVFHQLASYKPSIVSAYYSGSKPASAEIYLADFIKELDDLCENG
ncbi:hypothetical protein QAD02_018399 [Eretmocerus hayati]|uniref:Uncharacterized protein n=1 Tax=Eretmocerus hayati TaxID=131215 RepID=A0ACC2PGL5_9HYME|nr:hypothetical protein QAD02_018399 [Eretmocerus hayati]